MICKHALFCLNRKKEERSDATELLLNEFPAEYEPDARNSKYDLDWTPFKNHLFYFQGLSELSLYRRLLTQYVCGHFVLESCNSTKFKESGKLFVLFANFVVVEVYAPILSSGILFRAT